MPQNMLKFGSPLCTKPICVITLCFDEDFQVHVDISEEDAIENKSKIKVKETCQVRIADVLQESSQPTQPARGSVYCLPAVPPDIAMAVQRHQAGQHFAGRQRVLQWLHHDLYLYDMYPGRLYTEAARALVTRFPNLADATGTGYDSWREALRYKAKYERKKVRALSKEDVEKAPPQKRAAVNESAAPQRIERPYTATAMVEAEDGETVACHISAMAKEVLKARPDMAYIEDCMARTLASRREWVAKENPSVDEMLLKYPVLSISSIDPAKVHYVPTVTFTGGILTTQDFTVCLEGIAIKEGSLLAAIATQMALYWTFNIVFNKKAQKTFDLLCHLLKVHSGLRTTPLVRVAQTLLSQ
ncbi:hypothetical protein HPB49_012295 [Dermacentor silvarum]|uniref:Uncharacterized protein n=1 Tax=Dermacentor silvarum TaxID=543639 RepID=A0ACB8D5G2_DERSI|nr:hypothetical protein HPB49_012295 [Dermacentor silvarum]